MFQMTFAIITPALIAGAFAERMKFSALLIFMGLWLVFVYAPIAHWVWGGGWIAKLGALDFAGGTVVHVNAAAAALVCAVVVGARKDYARQAILPQNVPFTLLGAGLLWLGWFGFNAGSALGANRSAALAFTNTMFAPIATLVVWTLLDLFRSGKATAVGAATGIVVGLVAVTPAAGFISPTSAIILGAFAAFPRRICWPSESCSRRDPSRRLSRRRRSWRGRHRRRAAHWRAGSEIVERDRGRRDRRKLVAAWHSGHRHRCHHRLQRRSHSADRQSSFHSRDTPHRSA